MAANHQWQTVEHSTICGEIVSRGFSQLWALEKVVLRFLFAEQLFQKPMFIQNTLL